MSDREAALRRTLSTDRLAPYLEEADGNFARALSGYEANLRTSEAFHIPLHCVEIALRNVVDAELAGEYGEGWMFDGAILRRDTVEEVSKASAKLRDVAEGKRHGAMVAELSFGFWVSLLGPRYDATLWRRALHRAFRPVGKPMRRDLVHSRFNMIRRFRNRVAHHEPIWAKDLISVHGEIIEAVGWMCPLTAEWTSSLSRVPAVVGTRV